jgi:hypothetical protein
MSQSPPSLLAKHVSTEINDCAVDIDESDAADAAAAAALTDLTSDVAFAGGNLGQLYVDMDACTNPHCPVAHIL